MKKFKLFISNFFVYGIGGIINRLIPFIMIPVVVRMFPDTSYMGLNELFNTLSNFANTIALFGMYDAMFRFFFEQDSEEYKKSVCSTAFQFVVYNAFFVMLVMLIFRTWISNALFGSTKYVYLVILAAVGTFVNALSVMAAAPSRMENKRRIFLVTNAVTPMIAYTISLILLTRGMYESALPLGSIGSSIGIIFVFGVLNYKWFSGAFDIAKVRVLLTIALPVVPISFIYWIFNSCDRLMITRMISVNATGIYSVGAKFGTISQLIYTAFSGGWQFFAYSTMKEKNQAETNSNIFEYLAAISFLSAIAVCAVVYPVFKVFFEAEYIPAYLVTPYLFLAPLLQMLFQILASQMTIHKKTWMNTVFLCIAALFNVGADYILIPWIGVEGAAVSTLCGFVIALFFSIHFARKYGYFILSKRMIIDAAVFAVYYITWRLFYSQNLAAGMIGAFIAARIYYVLYKKEILFLVGALMSLT